MKRKTKIAFLSSDDPGSKLSWSGSHHYMFKALETKFVNVIALGPYVPKPALYAGKILNRITLLLFGKRFNYAHSKLIGKPFAKYFEKRILETKPDLIIAPAASSAIAYLTTKIPIVYITDATVQSSLDYHKTLSNLLPSSVTASQDIEQRAIDNSALVVLTSKWAADTVTGYYKKEKEKVSIIPFGANFEEIPGDSFARKRNLGDTCKLLLLGVNWESKGGPIVFNILKLLLAKGIKAELTVCGCVPPAEFKHEKLKVIPFLNKSIKEEREQLYKLFEDSTFLVLPTRYEAYGLVFCEASAYGLPSLATNTGGVGGVIEDGVNGFLFPPSDQGEGYAKKIDALLKDESGYKSLALSCRKRFEDKLNWDKWAEALEKKLVELKLIS